MTGDAASGINRGVAVLGDRVFMVTDNARLIALHRLTGQLLWDVAMADYHENYGTTSAPLVAGGLVISGTSGGDERVRGFLAAYTPSTGEPVWRLWTVPAAGEPGSETWSGRAMEHGCAATWLTGTYDPEMKALFWPTGNPCPDYNGDERKGDNLYSNCVLAVDAVTGKLKWYYQFTPHDLHDWDATETPVLVDAQFHGDVERLVVVVAPGEIGGGFRNHHRAKAVAIRGPHPDTLRAGDKQIALHIDLHAVWSRRRASLRSKPTRPVVEAKTARNLSICGAPGGTRTPGPLVRSS